jgi:hypothetical protein
MSRALLLAPVFLFLSGCYSAQQEEAIIANAQAAAHQRCSPDIAASIDREAAAARSAPDAGARNKALFKLNADLVACNTLAGKAPAAAPGFDPTGAVGLSTELGRRLADIHRQCQIPTLIGMTAEEVRHSCWGAPDRINRTERAGHVTEQWVYKIGYLYFNDGFLVSKQTEEKEGR